MTTPIRRAGITLDAVRFEQGNLPFWPDDHAAASPGSWVGQLGQVRTTLMGIAAKQHEQNESVRLAQAKRQTPTLPEPEARVRAARAEQKQLAAAHHKIAMVSDAIFQKRLSLKVFDSEQDGGGFVGALAR